MTAAESSAASTASATACGKVILLGEHAVVYGVPALCGALDSGASVVAIPGDGRLRVPAWDVVTASAAEVLSSDAVAVEAACSALALTAAYHAMLRSIEGAGEDARPLPIEKLRSDFVVSFAIPTGAGLGSSAALAVALLRCLDRTLALGLDDKQLDAAAFAAEKIFHGHPSGLDHTVAQHGGFGLFRRGEGLLPIVGLPKESRALRLLIGHTGRARDTKGRVARVAEIYQAAPKTTAARFANIEGLVQKAVAALKRGDLPALGDAMNRNQSELEALEVSCVEIEAMCQLARQAGALGAKLTGGGGGGCVVALAPCREAEVAAAWQAAGFTSFPVRIGTS
jgi:mevalonate kinase